MTKTIPLETIISIPITDNDEPIESIKAQTTIPLHITSTQFIYFGKEDVYARKSVIDKLKEAQGNLPESYSLLVLDGYRTPELETMRRTAILNDHIKRYNHLNKAQLEHEVAIYTAAPIGTTPHTTGGAINVTLAKDGKEVNMGSAPEGIAAMTKTDSNIINEEQQELRTILYEAMTHAGFANYPDKWWHYSYGDQAWAAYTGEERAIYGSVSKNKFQEQQ